MSEIKYKAFDRGCMLGPMGLLLPDAPEWLANLTSEAILLQFTGLLDKNGTEIYESDIVGGIDPGGEFIDNFVVEYDMGGYWFDYPFNDSDMGIIHVAEEQGFEFEVIGNLHEHPHLIIERE